MSSFAQRILVATDFSPASHLAVDAAAVLAKTLGAKVTLLHVVNSSPDFVGPIPIATGDIQATLHASAERTRHALEDLRATRLAGIETELKVVDHASPSEGICEAARKMEADLVVVATHGRTGLSHLLIGSVAERVVRHAPCPVLTLRSKAD